MVMVKKNQQKYLEKNIYFFSVADRDGWQFGNYFFHALRQRGTSEETFNLKSMNTATENVIKSDLSCSLNKKHGFQTQLYDRFLEAEIKSSPCTMGIKMEPLRYASEEELIVNPKLAWVTVIYTKFRDWILRFFFSCYRKYFHCCRLPTNTLYLSVLLQFLTYLKEIIWR